MDDDLKTIWLGTRGSRLALWQTEYIQDLLKVTWPQLHVETQIFTTKGDKILDTPLPLIGGKGLFTQELESALYAKTIDAAVHSLKDLPTESPQGLTLGAIPERANPADALVSRRGHTVDTLPKGATIGTSSRRRAAQLLHHRPDLQIRDIRGNVPTRLRKTHEADGPYDATVLAFAGLERLGLHDTVSQVLPPEIMLPAPGQGALAVQCRDDLPSMQLFAPLIDAETTTTVTAERAFLAGLGSGCSIPVSAHASIVDGQLSLQGRVNSVDGRQKIEVNGTASFDEADLLGRRLAQAALEQGAAHMLESEQLLAY